MRRCWPNGAATRSELSGVPAISGIRTSSASPLPLSVPRETVPFAVIQREPFFMAFFLAVNASSPLSSATLPRNLSHRHRRYLRTGMRQAKPLAGFLWCGVINFQFLPDAADLLRFLGLGP